MKKSVLIAGLVAVLAAAYVILVMPLDDKRGEVKELLRAKYSTLQKYEAFLKGAGKAETESKAAIKDVESMEANILQEKTESLAFAKLQGAVQDFAGKSGIKIISIKPLTVVKYKHYAGLPVQLEASGNIKQLGEFMKQIDESRQMIRIDRLNVNVVSVQMPFEMKMRIQISGLMPAMNSGGKT